MNLLILVLVSILCGICGIITSMLVIAFAKNRVEGMALIKLSGIMIAGIPVVYFVSSKIAYLCGILPSFWITKLAQEQMPVYAIPSLVSLAVWILLLYQKFKKRLL